MTGNLVPAFRRASRASPRQVAVATVNPSRVAASQRAKRLMGSSSTRSARSMTVPKLRERLQVNCPIHILHAEPARKIPAPGGVHILHGTHPETKDILSEGYHSQRYAPSSAPLPGPRLPWEPTSGNFLHATVSNSSDSCRNCLTGSGCVGSKSPFVNIRTGLFTEITSPLPKFREVSAVKGAVESPGELYG